MKDILQNILPVFALAPDADRYDSDPATDVISLKQHNEAAFIVLHGAGGTGTVVVTLEECDDTTPTTSTAIAFNYKVGTATGTLGALTAATASGFTISATANQVAAIYVSSDELTDGFPYVRLVLTEGVDDPVDAAVLCLLGEGRYKGDVVASPLT